MATRSPTIQHSFWGPFANAAALPLGDPRLQPGDTAYAQTEASLYVYDGAAWQPVVRSAQNFALDATATLSTPTVIGTIYLEISTLTVASVAYIGGSVMSDTTTLSLTPAGGGPAVATWTRTGLLGNQALVVPATIAAAGWYDLILTPGASGTAFARGLYLV